MNKRTRCGIMLISLFLVFGTVLGFCASAEGEEVNYVEREILVVSEGKMLNFDTTPVIIEGRTLVPLRAILESFGCDVVWDDTTSTVKASDDRITVEMKIGDYFATVYINENVFTHQLDVPAMIIKDRTYLPLRKIAEIYGAYVYWNDRSNTVTIAKKLTADIVKQNHTYYFQNEEKWQLPKFGSGYCWACSYAMIINDILGEITPLDIKYVNEQLMDDGALCYHVYIAKWFGLEFVSAIDESSELFDYFDYDHGATHIRNEEKTDEIATQALAEALKKHPEGVMVRYEEYPHTMVAVGYVDGKILFNEPANGWGRYSAKGTSQAIPFEKTYPYQKGLKLADMNYIQALDIDPMPDEEHYFHRR